jgi:hypothetical protein
MSEPTPSNPTPSNLTPSNPTPSNLTPSNPAPHTANPDIAALYLVTVVTVYDAGAWRPAHQVAARLGTLHVITAWNPGDERPSREENDLANRALRAELEALNLAARGLAPLPALGSDPNSPHAEESWAVTGLDDRAARELGAKYGQVAVFRITAARQTVLGCDEEWEVGRGCRAE